MLVLTLMVWSAVFFETFACDGADDPGCSVLGVAVLGANAVFVCVCGVYFAQSFGKRNRVSERLKGGIAASVKFITGSSRRKGGGVAGGGGGGRKQAGHARGSSSSSGVKWAENTLGVQEVELTRKPSAITL